MRVLRQLSCALILVTSSGCWFFGESVDYGVLYVSVADANGDGLGNVTVEVHRETSPTNPDNLFTSGTTNFEGLIEFTVPQGWYDVRVVSTNYLVVFDEVQTQKSAHVDWDGTSVSFHARSLREITVNLAWADGSDTSIQGPSVLVSVFDETGTPRRTWFTAWPRELTFEAPATPHLVEVSEIPSWIAFDETVLGLGTIGSRATFLASYVGERAIIAQVIGGDGTPVSGATIDFLDEATRQNLASGVSDATGEVTWSSPPIGRFLAVLSGFDPTQHTFPDTEIALDVGVPPGPYLARFEAQPAPANQPPVVSIIRPTDGTIFSAGQPATFTGSGIDVEDGFLSGAALTWVSSLDGPIGQGDSIEVSTLQAGAHDITLTALDSGGATDADTINVTISATGSATIQGTVTISGGAFGGIRVTATGPTLATTVTDPFGNYTLGGLAAGTYTVTVSEYPTDFTFNPDSYSVTVADGATATQNFTGSGG